MASSKETINQDGSRPDWRQQDRRRKDAENFDARPVETEGASVLRKSFRDEFRDRDQKPEQTSWDNNYKKVCGIVANSMTA